VISNYEIFLRLVIGAALGTIIGLEREAHGRPAGLRTNLLVCLSGVLLMVISTNYFRIIELEAPLVRLDPARIVAGAVTGIGFLGAGVIIKTRGTVYGLTTAASIWVLFAIGLAIGGGLYFAGGITFLLAYFTLWVLRIIERRIPKDIFKSILVVSDGSLSEEEILPVIKKHGVFQSAEYEKDMPTGELCFIIKAAFKKGVSLKELFSDLSQLKGIKRVKISAD
jgi:putative Mg2+ transporter-C (MgtC) family protein